MVGVLAALLLSAPLSPQQAGAEARAQFGRGMKAQADGNLVAAHRAFSVATQLLPDWPLPLLQLGIVEQTLDPHNGAALDCFTRAVQLAPRNPRARHLLGAAYARAERWHDAERELVQALLLRPRMLDVLVVLAQVQQAAAKAPEAIETWRKVLEVSGQHTGAWTALAELFEATGQLDEAERALLAITRVQPRVAYNHYRLAQFYERVGKPHKAREAHAQAEALDPRPNRKMRTLR